MSTTDTALPDPATMLPAPLSAHDQATAEAQAMHSLTDGYYGQFDISKLRASPDNRKRFNEQALQELAESIKTMGVAQAILIRPVTPTEEAPQEFEIVAGERRFRASKIAGRTHIPALCRQLSDLDAAKIRILENLQREDPHPMEEAEGYQLLMLQHGFTADQLIDEVKKSRAYIYARLKLCSLTPAVREQFLDNKLSASTALLVARIPVPELQVKAAQEIMNPYGSGAPMSARDAASHIQGRYMLKLSTAVFAITDAKLLATAGACTKCPKRTGNQPEIFEGIDPNVCTDPDCFSEKRAAHGAALLVEANKKGIPVLEGDEASQTLSRRYNRDSELVTTDMNLWYFNRNAPSTQNNGYVSDFLRGNALPAIASYAKKDDGSLTPLYKRADVQAALEACDACETVEAHTERMAAVKAADPVATAKEEAERKKAEARKALIDRENIYRLALYKQLRQRASVGALGLSSLREFIKAVAEENCLKECLHDLYESDVSTDLDGYIDAADAGALQLLLIDLVLGHYLNLDWWDLKNDGSVDEEGGFATVVAMARHEGIDPDAVREDLFPSPIDVANMQSDDLVEFIKAKPHRINELKDAVLNCMQRGDLIGPLERAAASLGYIYKDRTFVLAEAATSTAAEHVEQAAAPIDEIPAANDLVAQAAAPMGETQAAAGGADAEQLADQLAEVTPAEIPSNVQTSAQAKKNKTKQTAKSVPSKTPAAPAAAVKSTRVKASPSAKATK
jgi:ParB/RepB/Spo0J family partition protein